MYDASIKYLAAVANCVSQHVSGPCLSSPDTFIYLFFYFCSYITQV